MRIICHKQTKTEPNLPRTTDSRSPLDVRPEECQKKPRKGGSRWFPIHKIAEPYWVWWHSGSTRLTKYLSYASAFRLQYQLLIISLLFSYLVSTPWLRVGVFQKWCGASLKFVTKRLRHESVNWDSNIHHIHKYPVRNAYCNTPLSSSIGDLSTYLSFSGQSAVSPCQKRSGCKTCHTDCMPQCLLKMSAGLSFPFNQTKA